MRKLSPLNRRLEEAGETNAIPLALGVLAAGWRCRSLGPGDDAACLGGELENILFKIDGYSINSMMLPWMTLYDVGWKAVTAVASDLIAKGGKPVAFMVSLGLQPTYRVADYYQLVAGAHASARAHGAWLAGGDTNKSNDPWIDVAGVAVARKPIPRRPRSGDLVLMTRGRIGLMGVALDAMRRDWRSLQAKYRRVFEESRRPLARIEFLKLLENVGECVTASTDVSDGVAFSLYQLSLSATATIRVNRLPIEEEALEYSREYGLNPLDLALYAGEEYEIVFTVDSRCRSQLLREIESQNMAVELVGVVGEKGSIGVMVEGKVVQVKRWDQFLGLSIVGQNV